MVSANDSKQLAASQLYTAGIAPLGAALLLWSGFNVASAAFAASSRTQSREREPSTSQVSTSWRHRRRSSHTPKHDGNKALGDGKPTEESTVQVTYPTTLEMCDNAFLSCVALVDRSSAKSPEVLPKIRAGALLKLIDVVAGVSARKHAELSCVTVSVDSVLLLAPIYLGDLVHLSASVNRAWGSSLEVGVRVVKEDSRTGDREYVSHAYMTFVAISSPPSRSFGGIPQPPARVRLASRQSLSTTTVLSRAVLWLSGVEDKPKAPKVQLQALLPRTPLEARRHILAGRRRAKRIANAQKGEARDGVTTEIKRQLKQEVLQISKTGGKWKGAAEAETGSWTPGMLRIEKNDLEPGAGEDASATTGANTSQKVALEALELEFVVQAFLANDPAVTVNTEEGLVEINLSGDIPLRHPLSIVEKLARQIQEGTEQYESTALFGSKVLESSPVPLPSPSAQGVISYTDTPSLAVSAQSTKHRRRSVFLPLKPAQEREGDTDADQSHVGTPIKTSDSTMMSKPRTCPKLNKPIKVAKTMVRTIHIVFPEHTNSVGVLFGGQLMDWMEEAVLLSVRHVGRGKRWGTVSLDGLEFEQAVAVGESMTFTAVVVRTFVQSCEVYVLAEAESRNGTRRITNDALFTLAFPLDDHDIATSILGSTSDGARQRLLRQVEMPRDSALAIFAEVAVQRRQSRLEMKQMLVRIYSNPN